MRSSHNVLIACLLLVFAYLCASGRQTRAANKAAAQQADKSKPASAEGRNLFESLCAGCHGLDGHGGERGPDIATRQSIVQLNDSELAEVVRSGRPASGMPPFNYLGDDKLKQLLRHVRTLQGQGTNAPLSGNASNGKRLFAGKAGCSQCHMIQGEGGFLGRDLSNYGSTLSPGDIRTNIVKPGDSKANKTATVTLGDGRKFTGVIRDEDNFSIQLQSFDGTFCFLNRFDAAGIELLPNPIMPGNYGATLTPSELDDLVAYLVTSGKAGHAAQAADDAHEHEDD